nr:hypothetical protein [Escherichia coli]
MKKANKTLESNRVKKALKDLQNGPYNLLYKMSDEDEYRTLAPVNVWDNFRFTYFKFLQTQIYPLFSISVMMVKSIPLTSIQPGNITTLLWLKR